MKIALALAIASPLVAAEPDVVIRKWEHETRFFLPPLLSQVPRPFRTL